ncbi:unnamed protein product [Linum trigynum]|uniref:DUF4283 domain-containing protein n=1 Tax=Linum trigynum TaxID=586398 RepID=A0AAV2E1R9_9ROSI
MNNSENRSKSYAEVVKGGIEFYGAGKCIIKRSGPNRFIEVGDTGVVEREELLGRCLILSSVSFKSDALASFRQWAVHNWAIDKSFVIEDRCDGSWLLICPCVAEAQRIKSLEHLKFRGEHIKFLEWQDGVKNPRADVVRIFASNIPMHLKSVNLLKTIENFCGSFIDIDWNSWYLPFDRIRIKKTARIPNEVPLRFGSQSFSVKIVVSPEATSADGRMIGGKRKGHASVTSTSTLSKDTHAVNINAGGNSIINRNSRPTHFFKGSREVERA